MKVINDTQVAKHIKCWAEYIDPKTLQQARNLANLPFAFHHVALMSDCHAGFGMPIGGVFASEKYVIPNAVGVDIGCGIAGIKTLFKDEIDRDTWQKLMDVIKSVVPMGVGKNHKHPVDRKYIMEDGEDYSDMLSNLIEPARYQLGTLGSGNHFIEFQRDEDNYLWIMVHSGSRKFGYNICNFYNKLAIDLNEKYFSKVNKEQELAFLPIDSTDGHYYYLDHLYATRFAKLNRRKMMYAIMEATQEVVQKYEKKTIRFDGVFDQAIIDIHHNYVAHENHFNKNVFVHRKGAIRARKGDIGFIPGSQGSLSYVVEGLGNKESFTSCSHGAGRPFSRKDAIRNLDLESEIEKMNAMGTLHDLKCELQLDESVGAYKDIDAVMDEQQDLVKIIHALRPVMTLKG